MTTRHTASTITDDQLDALYAQRDAYGIALLDIVRHIAVVRASAAVSTPAALHDTAA